MGKIRRGNYVFLSWKGDHSPRHIHVYRDSKLVVKWDLENQQPMQGKAARLPQCLPGQGMAGIQYQGRNTKVYRC